MSVPSHVDRYLHVEEAVDYGDDTVICILQVLSMFVYSND